jgi:ATP-dependent DNA helicase RecQ
MEDQITSNRIASTLNQQFGIHRFRPGQQEAIGYILAGMDTLVVMPTGYGKSLIYQLSALLLPHTALVISPLISLMKDQVDSLVRNKISASYLNSSLSSVDQSNRLRILSEGGYKIFLVAPERLRNRAFNEALTNVPISLLVVDEAHCLSHWGHDFRPDYLHIPEFSQEYSDPVILALTATATVRVQKEIIRILNRESMKKVITGFDRPNLFFEVAYHLDLTEKFRYLHQFLSGVDGAGIIYTGTRRDAEEVAEFINEVIGKSARYYHAGLDPRARNDIQDLFMSGKLTVVAATNAFGMGIDRPDVRFVIHNTMPGSLEAYYQEAGRAGRDGKPAQAVLLYSPDDTALQEFFIDNDSPTIDDLRTVHRYVSNLPTSSNEPKNGIRRFHLDDLVIAASLPEVKARVAIEQIEAAGGFTRLPNEAGNFICLRIRNLSDKEIQRIYSVINSRQQHKRAVLKNMVRYAETNDCRRRTILDYFGDPSSSEVPICCDNCMSRKETGKEEIHAEKSGLDDCELIILNTISNIKWGIGKRKIAQILKGSTAKGVKRYRNHPNFAIIDDQRIKDIESFIEGLVLGDYVKYIGNVYPTLALTPKGEITLSHHGPIHLEKLSSLRKKPPIPNKVTSDTLQETYLFLAKGFSPEDVAEKRGLTLRTIYSHISKLIGSGKINIDTIVPTSHQQIIRAAIEEVGSTEHLSSIIALLPDPIDYNLISCVISAWNYKHSKTIGRSEACKSKEKDRAAHIHSLGVVGSVDDLPEIIMALKDPNGNVRRLAASALGKMKSCEAVEPLIALLEVETKLQVRQYSIKALGKIGDERARNKLEQIVKDLSEKEYNRKSARTALRKLRISATNQPPEPSTETRHFKPSEDDLSTDITSDSVRTFLSKPRPRTLNGPWLAGWALDHHSRYVGRNQIRSTIGNLVYKYKYKGEHHLAKDLVRYWVELLATHPDLPGPHAVIPIPSSILRTFEPVMELANQLATSLDILVMIDTLGKTRNTQQQKRLITLVAKERNIAGAFQLNGDVNGKHLLLIDDLYDSGATLCEAARTLARGQPASIVVLTLTKTIHSNL